MCMGVMINLYKRLAVKDERERPLAIRRCRCEDTIKADLTEIGCDRVDWTQLAQYRVQ